MCKTEYAEGGAKLHHPAQDRVKALIYRNARYYLRYLVGCVKNLTSTCQFVL